MQPGDSLLAIARAYGTTMEQLQAWNADRYPSLASNPDVIEPGWVLVVSRRPERHPAFRRRRPRHASPGIAAGWLRRTAATRAGGRHRRSATIPGAGAGVALTFDMGGRMDPAVDIMNFLVANDVCATIFATGVMSETPQGQQVMAIIRANPELFEIANHTMYHCDLARGGGGSPYDGALRRRPVQRRPHPHRS